MTNGQHDEEAERSSGSPLVIAGVGLLATLILLAAAAIPVLRDGGDGDAGSADDGISDTSVATTVEEPDDTTTTSLRLFGTPTTEEPTPETTTGSTTPGTTTTTTTEAPATTAAPETTAAPTTAAPTTAAPTTTVAPDPDVPESRATVRGGQIFLEGAVPTAEAGEELAALAAEILGPDNVFNNYIVDPRASDPNLGNITVEDTINFPTESAELLPESEGLLNQALALMTIRPSVTITVVGHTDARGDEEYNQGLSEERAEAVRTWLTDKGIDGDRIATEGRGESEPIATNDTPEGRRLNRRIQFFIENLLADS